HRILRLCGALRRYCLERAKDAPRVWPQQSRRGTDSADICATEAPLAASACLLFPSAMRVYQPPEPERCSHPSALDSAALGLSSQLYHRVSFAAVLPAMAHGAADSLHAGHSGVSGERRAPDVAGATHHPALLPVSVRALLLLSRRTL